MMIKTLWTIALLLSFNLQAQSLIAPGKQELEGSNPLYRSAESLREKVKYDYDNWLTQVQSLDDSIYLPENESKLQEFNLRYWEIRVKKNILEFFMNEARVERSFVTGIKFPGFSISVDTRIENIIFYKFLDPIAKVIIQDDSPNLICWINFPIQIREGAYMINLDETSQQCSGQIIAPPLSQIRPVFNLSNQRRFKSPQTLLKDSIIATRGRIFNLAENIEVQLQQIETDAPEYPYKELILIDQIIKLRFIEALSDQVDSKQIASLGLDQNFQLTHVSIDRQYQHRMKGIFLKGNQKCELAFEFPNERIQEIRLGKTSKIRLDETKISCQN